ncbi:S8 family serine peptidase [Gottfriedia sp. NPDC057991]|uniref:S8 family serine peptidase n=1 Tax=Gottfriedia sp. NPDC057991 TaxID=3346298 RepID=UPI0036D7A794
MKKSRKNTSRIVRSMAVCAMTTSFILSPLGHVTHVTKADSLSKTEEILANLTPVQREALSKNASNDQSGLFLSKDVNLDSSENVSVIVEFNEKPHKVAVMEAALDGKDLSDSEAKTLVDDDHSTFKDDLTSLLKNEKYKIKREYKNSFNGLSMEIPANQVKTLLKSKAVKAIYSDVKVSVDPVKDEASPSTEARGKGMAAENEYLNINKLHDEGYTGKGVKVGVLDTGIDYNHPDLSKAYKGYRAQPGVDPKSININSVKGWDFVGNDADPMETTYAEWVKAGKPGTSDGADYYTEHGTHVSGTIVGQGTNGSEYATNGVAPDADLYVYRVLGPGGSGSMDGIMAGIEKAVNDGMDIISLSLGANYNDPLFPTSIAINNAVLSGVTAVIAAGNAGNGMYTLGSPGGAALALTVGASDVPNQISTMKGKTDNVTTDLHLMAKGFSDSLTDLQNQSFDIVDVGLGQSFNYSSTQSYTNKVVLVQRGTSTINDKILQAKLKGAKAVLIFNNNPTEGHLPFYLGEGTSFIPTFSLTNTEGLTLQQLVKQGNKQFTFNQLGQITTQGDTLADFSSRGPARVTYDIKPEVTAPGVNVLSTVPGFVNDHNNPNNYQYAYEQMSGTSMATPFTTGVAALLKQARPDLQPEDIKSILMNTADPLSKPYSVFEVGAGRVDPYKAIHSSTEIKVQETTPTIINNKEKMIKENTGAISYGNIVDSGKDIADTRAVTFLNRSEKAKTFNVSATFQSNLRGSKDAVANGVTINTVSSITLKGISQKKANVTLNIPKTAEKGIYEGYIVYTNKDNPSETYRVPFGVHYVEEGFDSFRLARQSGISVRQVANFSDPRNALYFTLKSHMRSIDFIISDAKTGEDIGIFAQADGVNYDEGVEESVMYPGYYFPYDSINDSIILKPTALKEGQYKMKLIGHTDSGKSFTVTQDFFIENEKPKFDIHVDGETPNNPIIEYNPNQSTIGFTGNIFDKNVDVRKAAGLKADQSQNNIYTYYNSPFSNGKLTLDKDGDAIDENGNKKDAIATMPSASFFTVMFEGVDQATNNGGQKMYYFTKEGTPYVFGKANAPTYLNNVISKPGDDVKITLTANNASKVQKVNYTFNTTKTDTIVNNVELTKEAKELGATLTWTKTDLSPTIVKSSVDVTFDGSHEVSGDIPMVDVTVNIQDIPKGFVYGSSFSRVTSTFTSIDNVVTKPTTIITPIGIAPSHSEAFGYFHAEGLTYDNANLINSGTKVTIVDSKGKTYSTPAVTFVDANGKTVNSAIDKSGVFYITGLPVTKDEFTIIQEIPGHFTTKGKFTLFNDLSNGLVYGKRDQLGTETVDTAIGGDVNQDNVIDIMDAIAIQTYWGTNKRSADINFDGTVDAKDFEFVEMNYLLQNENSNAPKPLKKYKGKTIDDIKNELGIK